LEYHCITSASNSLGARMVMAWPPLA
jgi:hypothetical protein